MADPQVKRTPVLEWAWIFYLVLAVGGIVWIGLRQGQIGLALFVDTERWPVDLGLGLGAGAVLSGGWELGRRFMPQARAIETQFAEILGPLTTSEAVALAVLSAIAEEFFFRGAVQGAWGLVPAALLFTVLHVGPGRELRLWTVFAAVAGLLLGILVVWRETLMAAIIAHALVNGIGLSRLAVKEKGAATG